MHFLVVVGEVSSFRLSWVFWFWGVFFGRGVKSQNVLTTTFYRWGLKSPEKTSDLPKATRLAGSETNTRSVVF